MSLKGAPVAGVRVEQFVVTFKNDARVPGGRFEGTALRRGRSTTTDEDGNFVLRDVGRRFSHFALAGDRIVPTQLDAGQITDPEHVRVEVEARCHLEVVLFDAAEADQVRCLDGSGEQLDLAVLRRSSNTFMTELQLHEGRSGLFVVGERAAKLELLRDGQVVRTIAITPDPSQTTTLN